MTYQIFLYILMSVLVLLAGTLAIFTLYSVFAPQFSFVLTTIFVVIVLGVCFVVAAMLGSSSSSG